MAKIDLFGRHKRAIWQELCEHIDADFFQGKMDPLGLGGGLAWALDDHAGQFHGRQSGIHPYARALCESR